MPAPAAPTAARPRGLQLIKHNGFVVIVSKEVLWENERSTLRRPPMKALELELNLVADTLPPRAVEVLRQVPIWVRWDVPMPAHTSSGLRPAIAKYHPGARAGEYIQYATLEDAVKSNCVEVLSMRSVTEEAPGRRSSLRTAARAFTRGSTSPVQPVRYDDPRGLQPRNVARAIPRAVCG